MILKQHLSLALALNLSLTLLSSERTDAILETIDLGTSKELHRATIHYISLNTDQSPQAALILCPGANGDGAKLINEGWIDYAQKTNLGLVSISFTSDERLLRAGGGYYYPTSGSGEKLLEGINQIYGRDLPVLLYGFSGGAHFVSRFVEHYPEKTMAWCAYSFGWWDQPNHDKATDCPPGIVACGDLDLKRHSATFQYFLTGRELGRPWLWLSLPETGHQQSSALDGFVRDFFLEILENDTAPIQLRDSQTKELLVESDFINIPLASVLPSESLASDWLKLHSP